MKTSRIPVLVGTAAALIGPALTVPSAATASTTPAAAMAASPSTSISAAAASGKLDPCAKSQLDADLKRFLSDAADGVADSTAGGSSIRGSAETREARTALRYVTAFYPRWFTYYQQAIAPCNELIGPRSMNPLYQSVVAINDDTLYASSVVDVSEEPVIVTVPATSAVYSILHLDGFGNVFPGIPAGQPGTYALTGSNWRGSLPRGVTQVQIPFDVTNLIFRADRYAADGQSTEQAAAAFRTDLRLATLPDYLKDPSSGAPKIVPVAVFGTPFKLIADRLATQQPLTFLRSLKRAIDSTATQPLTAAEQRLAERLQRNLQRPRARAQLKAGVVAAHDGIVSNYLSNTLRDSSWITFRNMGEWRNNFAGYRDRSSIAEYILYGNNRTAARYFHSFTDSRGRELSGGKGPYQIRFTEQQLPKVKRFWSLTAYTPKAIELIPNAERKYLVGSYTPGLVKGSDGSVTITIAQRRPSGVPRANWLPVRNGQFNVMLRAYGPEGRLAAGGYTPPPVERVR